MRKEYVDGLDEDRLRRSRGTLGKLQYKTDAMVSLATEHRDRMFRTYTPL